MKSLRALKDFDHPAARHHGRYSEREAREFDSGLRAHRSTLQHLELNTRFWHWQSFADYDQLQSLTFVSPWWRVLGFNAWVVADGILQRLPNSLVNLEIINWRYNQEDIWGGAFTSGLGDRPDLMPLSCLFHTSPDNRHDFYLPDLPNLRRINLPMTRAMEHNMKRESVEPRIRLIAQAFEQFGNLKARYATAGVELSTGKYRHGLFEYPIASE